MSFPRKRESLCLWRENFIFIFWLAKKNGVLYIGITNNLERRTEEHKVGLVDGFSKKYFVKRLVYFEEYSSIIDALTREKQLQKWNREWKIKLIEKGNPNWDDIWRYK